MLAAVGIPGMQIFPAAQFTAVAFAQRGPCETIGECATARVQEKDKGEQALQRSGVDVGLIGGVALTADTAPIPDGEVTIAVLHGDRSNSYPPRCVWPKTGRRCGFV